MKKILLTISIIHAVYAGYTQDLLTNHNALITLTGSVPLTIQGNFNNSGTINNEGDLRLSGNWANSGSYSSGSGTFTLNGDNQVIEPGDDNYPNFTLNTTGAVATSDLNITQSLYLVKGILSMANDASVQLHNEASIIGGDESSYVDGSLFTAFQGDFTFPIGTEREFLPVHLTNIQSTGSVGVQSYSEAISTSLSNEIDAISPNRYWHITSEDEFTADAISLPVLNESFIEFEDEIIVAFAKELDHPLKISGIPDLSGSLSSGTVRTTSEIVSGYYVIGDKSIAGPPITVVNVVTAMQDGKHDFLRIENIEFYEGNKVEVFNRAGTKVFEMSNYNNLDRVFRGLSNVGNREQLATGSYYFTIQMGEKKESGFIYLKN